MFKSQAGFSNSMFGSYAYAEIIKRNQNNPLIKLAEMINWVQLEEKFVDCYSHLGQHAFNPVIMIKILILQKMYNLSDRDVMENLDMNIGYRYFVGFGLQDKIPHWTELGKFKSRISVEKLEEVFYWVIEEAGRLGIKISNKRIPDSTDIKANVDIARCKKDQQDKDDNSYIDRNTSDTDANFGRKNTGNKKWYGYKSHINQDPESEIVTAFKTTPANIQDSTMLLPMIATERYYRGEHVIAMEGGDKGYLGNTSGLKLLGIKDYVIPRKNMTAVLAEKAKNNHYKHLKRIRYKVEQKQSEAKNRYGLAKAKYRSRVKVHWQNGLTYIVINLKRILCLLSASY